MSIFNVMSIFFNSLWGTVCFVVGAFVQGMKSALDITFIVKTKLFWINLIGSLIIGIISWFCYLMVHYGQPLEHATIILIIIESVGTIIGISILVVIILGISLVIPVLLLWLIKNVSEPLTGLIVNNFFYKSVKSIEKNIK